MDKFLRPERFDESTWISWTHWKKTFENVLESFITAPTEKQKLHLLTNLLSSSACAHISDYDTYDDTLNTYTFKCVRKADKRDFRQT